MVKKIDTSFVIKTPRQTCMDDRKYPVTRGIYGRHASRTRPHVAAYPPSFVQEEIRPLRFLKGRTIYHSRKRNVSLPLEETRKVEREEKESSCGDVYNCL